jgi:2-dehydropantoate 2-reductase
VLAISAAKEAAEVAGALDVKLPFADPSERVDEVCRLTAKNSSSMLQDIQRGAMTEVDAINGAVIRYGRETGIPTPVNELLLSAVLEKQAGNQIDMQGLHVVAA